MRILYITSGGPGGISSHVRCLTQCLKGIAETAVCIVDRDEVLWRMLEEDGTPYYRCECATGHDPALFFKVRHSVRDFRPDVIHLHGIQLLSALYLRLFTRIPRVCSIHTPSRRKPRWDRDILNRLVLPCYFLPVSTPTWDGFKSAYPKARGEVFFNPIRVESNNPTISNPTIQQSQIQQSNNFIVGMVGRNADQKDWPSFHKVEALVRRRFSDCLIGGLLDLRLFDCRIGGMGASNNPTILNQTISSVEFLNAGEKELCNGREAIARMDLFVMTSKHEQLPTTVLECFALGTPICGFIPVGGTSDILGFSKGPVREAFIAERNCEKLADIVMDLMAHPEKRQALVEDGRQILENHFDAEKNCRGQLMRVYEKNCWI